MNASIRSALLIPTERPPMVDDIKRALLCYDQVHLPAADDRELFPPIHFFRARLPPMPFPMPFTAGSGPVLPMGKVAGFDSLFEQTLEASKAALTQASLVVRDSPGPLQSGSMLFGGGNVGNPSGWADPAWVLNCFRALANDEGFMRKACGTIPTKELLQTHDLAALALGGAAIGAAQLASTADGSLPDDLQRAVDVLAATRLGAVVKHLGICENTGLEAFSADAGIAGVLEHVEQIASGSLAAALDEAEERRALNRLRRLERVMFKFHVSDSKLAKLSVPEVLALRTKAWGAANENRAALVETARRISAETDSDEEFDKIIQSEIKGYLAASSDLSDEWKKFGFRASVPVFQSGVAVTVAAATDLIQTVVALNSWGLTVALASWSVSAAGKLGADGVSLWRKWQTESKHDGKAIIAPYRPFLK